MHCEVYEITEKHLPKNSCFLKVLLSKCAIFSNLLFVPFFPVPFYLHLTLRISNTSQQLLIKYDPFYHPWNVTFDPESQGQGAFPVMMVTWGK